MAGKWQPIEREEAQKVLDEFFARGRHGETMILRFEERLQLREAFLVLLDTEPGIIRRDLEESWGSVLD
jgi:hypothetical protein